MDRLKDSRAKLKDRFRNLHIKEATEFPDNDSFIEELMKEELKCLRKEQSSESGDMDLEVFIRLTYPCNVYPLIPHFYIVKLRFTGVCTFFLLLYQNIDCTHNLCFEQKILTISNFFE